MFEAIILDTETTDKEDAEVIELGWKTFPSEDPVVVTRYRPSKAMAWGALATHHIIPSDLIACPPAHQAPGDLPPSRFLIGHNIDFDWKMLGQPEGLRICTMAMAQELWPTCDSFSLTALTYFTQGATEETRSLLKGAHAADIDIRTCELLLRTIMKVTKIEDLGALYEFSEEARIPKFMTFGKFKGQPISAVDRGYMNWYRCQDDVNPYVIEAFRRNGM